MKKISLIILFSLFLTGCQIQNPFAPEPISVSTDLTQQSDNQTNDSTSQSIDNSQNLEASNLLVGSWNGDNGLTLTAELEKDSQEDSNTYYFYGRQPNWPEPFDGSSYYGWIYNVTTSTYIKADENSLINGVYISRGKLENYSADFEYEYVLSVEKDNSVVTEPTEVLVRVKVLPE